MQNNSIKNQSTKISNQILDLQSMERRIKKLTTRLWAGIFLLFIMLAAGILLFANFYYEQLALALTGNYTMTSGDLLTAGDWNTLADDFVDKSGDTMSGNLTAPNVCNTSGDCLDNLVSKSGDTMSGNLTVNGRIDGSHGQKDCYWGDSVGWGGTQAYCDSGYYLAGVQSEDTAWEIADLAIYCCKF